VVPGARDAVRSRGVPLDERADGGLVGAIAVPTLVIHGAADPLFPVEHGVALAAEIPGARLLRRREAGHGLARADHHTVARAILEHMETAEAARRS
jgi:pimeloyl-ACP methyl ester carboxylesterase